MPDACHGPVPVSAVSLLLRAILHACWDLEWPLGASPRAWLQQESFERDRAAQVVSLFYVFLSPGCAQVGSPGAGCLLSKTGWSFPCGSVCLTSVQANSVTVVANPTPGERRPRQCRIQSKSMGTGAARERPGTVLEGQRGRFLSCVAAGRGWLPRAESLSVC